MNKIFAIGRLTADPTNATTAGGTHVLSFSLASDTYRKDNNNDNITNFYRVSVFGKTAEVMAPMLKKGMKVAVSGDLVFRSYVDKNGVQRQSNDVSANGIDICTPRNASGGMDAPVSVPAGGGDDDDSLPF